MEEFRLRKALNVLPILILIFFMLGLGMLTIDLYLTKSHQEQRLIDLEHSISALNQQDKRESGVVVSFPIHENMSEVYEDFSVLAMTSGRFDLARRYVEGVSPERKEVLSELLSKREEQKSEIQALILKVLSDRESLVQHDADSSVLKGLISIESVNETSSHDVMMTRNLLMVAYLSAELGFAGWEDVRQQLKDHAEVIVDVAPKVAEICQELSEYDASVKVAND